MDTQQDSVQIQQPISPISPAPFSENHLFVTPIKEDVQCTEDREPLRAVCNNDKENQETPDQEQNENQEESNESGDKITEYVAKVLEKLVNQRNKMAKLTSVLEKKGLLTERKVSQDQTPAQEAVTEDVGKDVSENDFCDGNAKENLSPIKSKPEVKADAVVAKGVLAEKKAVTNFNVEDVLQVSRREISYGYCFPGQILEEHLDIVNKSGHDFVVQIIVTCSNDELQDTEEYVYSVRRSHLYDYNDKHYLIMAPYSIASFKFAMKVPNMRINGKVDGQVNISIQGATGSYTLDLTTNVSVPKVFCPKELYFKGLPYKVIKVAVKEAKKQDFKIPIRNQGETPITLELEFHEPEGDRTERPLFECMVHPNVITVAPNSNTLTNLLVKPCKFIGSKKDSDKVRSERKILVGRVKDSALVYSFVFWMEVY